MATRAALVHDINNACGENKFDTFRLERAFDRVYNEFANALESIEAVETKPNKPGNTEIDKTRTILEEILDLTRNNQKIFSNSDLQGNNVLKRVEDLLEHLGDIILKSKVLTQSTKTKVHPIIFEKMSSFSPPPLGIMGC